MLTKREKTEVLQTVHLELVTMFGVLHNRYSRPDFAEALPEEENIEAYLREKLAEYEQKEQRH